MAQFNDGTPGASNSGPENRMGSSAKEITRGYQSLSGN